MDPKKLYEEAGNLLHKARAILDAFEGQDVPAEKAEEYDRLMDEHDAKVAQAKRLERTARAESFLDEPQNPLDTPVPPGGDTAGQETPPEVKAAWGRYMRGFSLKEPELKALQTDDDERGGFLVMPEQEANRFLQAVDDALWIRGLAEVVRITNADSLGVPSLETDLSDADWTVELGTGSEDDELDFGKRALYPHPLAKRVKVSNTLLRKAPQAENIVYARMRQLVQVTEEKGFMEGTGANQPLGCYTASDMGISTSHDTTAADDSDIAADDLITCKHELKAQYWPGARWVIHRTILKEIRQLKDGNGQYIWNPGLASDLPSSILDIPYVVSEYAPDDSSTGLYVAIIGDFSYYWIADALDIQIQVLKELYAEDNQTGYIIRKETDGMPVLGEAFRRLKMA